MMGTQAKGITLIALVVTIVVLLILSGITLNLLFSNDGIFNIANQSNIEFEIGALKDRINNVIADWSIERLTKPGVTIDDLWDKMVEADIIDNPEEDVSGPEKEGENDAYQVTTNEGYVVEIIVMPDGSVVIGDVVKGDKLPPKIVNVETTSGTNNIQLTVTMGRWENGTISYYYKKDGEEDINYKAFKENTTELTANIEGLEQNVVYNIKIVAENENGSTEKIVNETTGELKEGTVKQKGPTVWSNETASIELETTQTGVTIQYQIDGTEGEWQDYTGPITGLNHGQTVYAVITDGTNISGYTSIDILDEQIPNAPTISITSGTAGNNGYYKSNVTVTITAGNDAQSGANKVRYSVSGAQTINQTETADGITSANITISTDGTSTITAYTLDKAGNVSSVATQIINKDSTAPSTASLTVGTVGETSIAVTASGVDATSGVYSYQFQRSTTSATSEFTTVATQTSSATSYSYTYNNLTGGTTYYLRVVVTDRAGNTATSTVVTKETMDPNRIENILKAGDWVRYEDGTGVARNCVVLYDSSSPYGVEIITMETVESITLGGYSSNSITTESMNDYRDVIDILNDATSKYLNTNYADRGRSVGSVPNNSNYDEAGMFTRSDSWFSSYNGQFKNMDTNYLTDWSQMEALGIQDVRRGYWLASRLVNLPSSQTDFAVRCVRDNGTLSAYSLFSVHSIDSTSSDYYTYSDYYLNDLRPIFHLRSNIKVTGGTGEEGDPYILGT